MVHGRMIAFGLANLVLICIVKTFTVAALWPVTAVIYFFPVWSVSLPCGRMSIKRNYYHAFYERTAETLTGDGPSNL